MAHVTAGTDALSPEGSANLVFVDGTLPGLAPWPPAFKKRSVFHHRCWLGMQATPAPHRGLEAEEARRTGKER